MAGKGLSSYPHPWLMPNFWEFPTGSMGLGPLTAVYQARFMRYLENRGLLSAVDRKVWAFVGDGEMDEPESLAGLTLAGREKLDNLIFVVNCNLQRLDGPVRGNGSIIQELERVFVGAGWHVIKLLWGSDWDDLFAQDQNNIILQRLKETVDGELQSYAAHGAAFNREHFFNKYDELRELSAHLSDDQIDGLTRGGHDPLKIYAAFDAASRHTSNPTVILAQTKKGYGLGKWAEGRMSTHQQKKLNQEALRMFRDRFDLPLSNEDVDKAQFYRPPSDSAEMRYLRQSRQSLGGSVPERLSTAPILEPPRSSEFASFAFAPGDREMSTTVAFVRMLTGLLKNDQLARHMFRLSRTRPALSEWNPCSGRSESTRIADSFTNLRITPICCFTRRPPTVRSWRKASPRLALSPHGLRLRPLTVTTVFPCFRSTFFTRFSDFSASGTRSGRR